MSSPVAGPRRLLRHTVVRAALALAIAVALVGLPAAARPARAFAGSWYDGLYQYSTITNCGSIIWGNPYPENGSAFYVGYLADPNTSTPSVGQVYYLHAVMYGMGNSCAGQYAVPYLTLPANTQLAISPGNPVYCLWEGGNDAAACPQSLPYNSGYGGYLIKPNNDVMWPIPQGKFWEFQVPVVSTTTLSGSKFGASFVVADGNANPTVVATQNAFVFSGTGSPKPAIQYPTPSTREITRTSAKSYANIYTGGLSGYVHFQMGKTTSYELYNGDPYFLSAGTANWELFDDWTPTVLTPDTLYHFRMWFDPGTPGGADGVYGADQTFRTAGAVTSFSVTGLPGSMAGGQAGSVTVTAKDSTGATVTSYAGTVAVSTSDAGGVVPANYTFAAGTGSATLPGSVIFANAGTQTITVQDVAKPAAKGTATVNVTSTAAKPTASMKALSSWRASTSIPLAWSGTGASFDVLSQRAAYNGTFGNYSVYKNNTTTTSATFAAAAGSTYCFRTRSIAANGIGSDLTPATCTAIPLDERSATKSSGWTAGTGSAYYKGTYLRTTTKGAKLTRTGVKAKRVAIVAQTCPTCGKVSVYMGSTLLKTVSLVSTTTKNKVIIPITTYPATKSGTLSVKVVTSGKKVLIDGIVISAY